MGCQAAQPGEGAESLLRYMGLDLGEKRIGVALSDPGGSLSFPHAVVHRKNEEEDLVAIKALIEQHGVGQVVVGLPRTLRGEVGQQGEKAQDFVAALSGVLNIPVVTWDERLSTVEAERVLREGGVKAEKKKLWRDAVAASLILQGFLERRRVSP